MLSFLLMRFLEPSSYAGGTIAATAITGMVQHGPTVGGIAAALGGIAAFLIPGGLTTPAPAVPATPAT